LAGAILNDNNKASD